MGGGDLVRRYDRDVRLLAHTKSVMRTSDTSRFACMAM